jgi:acetyl-CoA C-acetyltransferase
MNTAIVGIGIHPFGRFDGVTGPQMGAFAVRQAVRDAGLEWKDIQVAFGGSAAGMMPDAGDNSTPDSLVSQLGLTGVPFTSVVNGCATAGSALAIACMAVDSGQYDIALAVGFDKHPRGMFNPSSTTIGLGAWYGETGMMVSTQFFAMKIQRYMHDHGITSRTLAKVAAKAYRNGALNPNAWRRKPMSEDEILESTMLNHPLTQYMFCSPDEGAAAVVVCRADKARNFTPTPVYVKAALLRTRQFGSFEVWAPGLPVDRSSSPSVDASRAAFEFAGIEPKDVHVSQIQDSEAGAEVMHMAETGLCQDGEQEKLLADRATDIGGPMPINTDGGLIANGEPVGASGMRQIYENVLQLRGDAGERQVPNDPTVAFTQVYGAPGVSACTILTR